MTTLAELTEKLNTLSIDLDNIIRMKSPQRIVCKLIKLCGGKSKFQLPMTKGRLALLIGIEQETMSRSIPKLKEHGVRIEDKTVTFTDLRLTTKGVCDNCAARHTCKELFGLISEDRKAERVNSLGWLGQIAER